MLLSGAAGASATISVPAPGKHSVGVVLTVEAATPASRATSGSSRSRHRGGHRSRRSSRRPSARRIAMPSGSRGPRRAPTASARSAAGSPSPPATSRNRARPRARARRHPCRPSHGDRHRRCSRSVRPRRAPGAGDIVAAYLRGRAAHARPGHLLRAHRHAAAARVAGDRHRRAAHRLRARRAPRAQRLQRRRRPRHGRHVARARRRQPSRHPVHRRAHRAPAPRRGRHIVRRLAATGHARPRDRAARDDGPASAATTASRSARSPRRPAASGRRRRARPGPRRHPAPAAAHVRRRRAPRRRLDRPRARRLHRRPAARRRIVHLVRARHADLRPIDHHRRAVASHGHPLLRSSHPTRAHTLARELSALGGLDEPLQRDIDDAARAVNTVWSLFAAWGGHGGYGGESGFGHGFGTGSGLATSSIVDTIGTATVLPTVDLTAQLAGPLAACGPRTDDRDRSPRTLDEITDVSVSGPTGTAHVPRERGVEHARHGAGCAGGLARAYRL